jgi:hypothetical protein
MLVGYMRVSSADDRQSVDLQRDALLAAGVDARHLFTDKASGAKDDRPGLKACLDYLREGDCLTVWKLDRLGRSLPHLLAIVTELKGRGIALRSLIQGEHQKETTRKKTKQRNAASSGRSAGFLQDKPYQMRDAYQHRQQHERAAPSLPAPAPPGSPASAAGHPS